MPEAKPSTLQLAEQLVQLTSASPACTVSASSSSRRRPAPPSSVPNVELVPSEVLPLRSESKRSREIGARRSWKVAIGASAPAPAVSEKENDRAPSTEAKLCVCCL